MKSRLAVFLGITMVLMSMMAGCSGGGDDSDNAPSVEQINKDLEGLPPAPAEGAPSMGGPKKGTLGG